jgi:hypothetical protein
MESGKSPKTVAPFLSLESATRVAFIYLGLPSEFLYLGSAETPGGDGTVFNR